LGHFFAFEGLDGSGKSTQARLLSERLAASGGPKPLLLREPSSGPTGQAIRERLSGNGPGLDPQSEMELFLADRAWDAENNILPALRLGRPVIIDRYVLSNVAYQGARGLIPIEAIFSANAAFPVPDLTFLLEIPPETAWGRIKARGPLVDNFESLDYLKKVKAVYDSLSWPGLTRIPAELPPETVHGRVLSALSGLGRPGAFPLP
jgi:dTMP kinase